jgi:hypothetical protein
MDLREIGMQAVGFVNISQDKDKHQALVNVVMNFRFSQNADDFYTRKGTVSFLTRTTLIVVS